MTKKHVDSKIKSSHPVDVVILWVDGEDQNHKAKMLPYLEQKEKIQSKSFRTRFDQVNEIQYTIDSILKFAPFVRQIFLVTDNQIPEFLNNKKNQDQYRTVTTVDHKEIFKEHETYLPTFNCRSIESCLFRIPNLSEHFIYFNDDFFLINETKIEDFFIKGLPVLRGRWKSFDENKFYKKFKTQRKGHKFAQQLAAKLVGFNAYYNFRHTPHPMRKSTFETFFKINPEIFHRNIKYRFRNINQFTPQGLANHIEIKNKSCVLKKDRRLLYFRSYKKPLLWYKLKLNLFSKNKLFFASQSLDLCPPKKCKYILNWLKNKIHPQ
jgi:hypothetical protein